jgi:amino acid efflux transporter
MNLSTTRGAALYIGALLGPSLLLLPGLAAQLAGAASVIAWTGLLIVSGLLARVFTALGTRIPSGGLVGYAAAGLGARAGRATGWCFVGGVVTGAPVVCLIGGTYVADLLGGGRAMSVIAAALLLVIVLALTLGGARTTTTAQLVLVGALIALVAFAVVGSAPSARTANWTPFAPHGWTSIGRAASVLMFSFVGWEAIAPLTAQLRDPRRQLPRVIGIAFAVTTTVYLGLAVTTIAVLGAAADSPVPLADLLRVVIGSAGPVIAAVAAVALTLATTNAYLSGAAALVADLRTERDAAPSNRLQIGIALAGVALLAGQAAGLVSTAQLVALPTTLFVTVYLLCTAAAARILAGRARVAAVAACVAVLCVLAFSGWALIGALVVVLGGFLVGAPTQVPDRVGVAHRAIAQPATLGKSVRRSVVVVGARAIQVLVVRNAENQCRDQRREQGQADEDVGARAPVPEPADLGDDLRHEHARRGEHGDQRIRSSSHGHHAGFELAWMLPARLAISTIAAPTTVAAAPHADTGNGSVEGRGRFLMSCWGRTTFRA